MANSPPASNPNGPSTPRVETSGLAISSLILGILAWPTIGLAGIGAVICGHVALSRIKRSAGRLAGKGMALAGLILGYLSILCLPVIALLAALAIPAFSSAQDRALATKSLSQARQICLACTMYATDNDGAFPPSLENLVPTYISDRSILVSPFASDKNAVSYDYTPGLTQNDSANQVLVRDHYASKRGLRAVMHVGCSGELTREQ